MKLTHTLFCIMIAITASAQAPVKIARMVDDMTGKAYIFPDRRIATINQAKTHGFYLSAHIRDGFRWGMVTAEMIGMGTCSENDELIILFTNGEKITKTSFNSFNCNGEAMFLMDPAEYQLLKTVPMHRVRVTNSTSLKEHTETLTGTNATYFIDLIKELEAKRATDVKM